MNIKQYLQNNKDFIERLTKVGNRVCIVIYVPTSEVLGLFDYTSLTNAEGGSSDFIVKGQNVEELLNQVALTSMNDQVFLTEYQRLKDKVPVQEIRFEAKAFTYINFVKYSSIY